MWTGTPIVATGWGGHTDFLTRDNSFPVKYRLVDVAPEFFLRYPGFYGARWAEPDVGDLKKQMRRVWKNRTLSAVRTRRALQDVQRFASSKVCEEILRRLNDPLELPGRTGQAANLFSRLFPVFFPGNPGGEEIRRLAEADFGRRIASVALAGQGPALHRAADCVTRVVGIKNVVFLKLEDGDDSPANLGSVKLQNFNPESHPVDAVILACYVERVADYYHTILNHTDTLPLYVFD
jgi:hypothetical protein